MAVVSSPRPTLLREPTGGFVGECRGQVLLSAESALSGRGPMAHSFTVALRAARDRVVTAGGVLPEGRPVRPRR